MPDTVRRTFRYLNDIESIVYDGSVFHNRHHVPICGPQLGKQNDFE